MLKFNNNEIITGYIKQLLSTFNLPTIPVYTNKDKLLENTEYIKNNKIQFYDTDKKWQNTNLNYYFNDKILNRTKQLKITNNIYDSYTHEYLGEYLRFQRDYNNINLMSLYNCFSNRICNNLKLTLDIPGSEQAIPLQVNFNSSDTDYKIYMLPVKLFENYTIAIDSDYPVEVVCSNYDKYNIFSEVDPQGIERYTYKVYNQLNFSRPVLYDNLGYDKIKGISNLKKYATNLKLFIKIPVEAKSSIIVLEGNYLHYNDFILNFNTNTTSINHTIINYSNINDEYNFNPISPLQLLGLNTGDCYPFSDALIGYLLDNTITPLDEISDNIKRVQQIIGMNVNNNTYGLWDPSIRPVVYDQLMTNKKLIGKNFDILGYIDKTAETNYRNSKTSIANANIYSDKEWQNE